MAQGPKVRHGDALYKGYTDFDQNEARNLRLQNLAADVGTPVEGLIFYRTDTDRIRAYADGAWQDIAWSSDVASAGIQPTIVDAKGDLIVGSGADTVVRKPVGSNGHAFFANSVDAAGVEWRQIANTDVSGLGSLATKSTVATGDITDAAVTYAKLQDIAAASRILGRGSAGGAGDTQELTVGGGVEISGTTVQTSAFTGDVTKTAGATATTIATDAVSNTKLANMPASTIKGNNTAGVADPADLTTTQVKTLLAITPTDVTGFDTQVRTSRLDQMAAPTAAVSLNSQKITNLADGTASTDAATFGQLTAAVQGQTFKEPVRLATTVNDTLSGLAVRDGITPVAGDRVLVKNQTTSGTNGIYVAAAGAWTRSADADTAAELNNATVLIRQGTTHSGDIFTQTTTQVTLGTTAQTWVQSGEGNTVYTSDGTTIELVGNSFRIATGAAGNGLTGGGASALAVNPGTGLEISSDAVRIAAAAAGNGLTGGAGSALAVGAGTGISVTADAVAIDTAVVVRKTAGALTGGANSEVLTHNLNTRDIAKITLINTATPYDAVDDFYWEATSVNTVTIYAGSGYTLPAAHRWVVLA